MPGPQETVMADEILERIWRVREELLKKHGGWDGYFKYIQKLDRTRLARPPKKRKKSVRKRASAKS
jgi:hypothetical protein